jgi:SAM-dependent methyltransferase
VIDPADVRGGKNRLIHRVHLRTLSRNLARVQGEQVLDFGCGTGRISAWLVERGAVVEGVDVTSAMVDAARVGVPAASFRVVDGQSLPFADDSFGIVVSVYVLQYYVAREESVLPELARVLRPRGRLVAIEQVADGDMGRGGAAGEYKRGLEAVGLEVDRVEPIRRSDARVVFAAQRFPLLSRLPAVPWLVERDARNVDVTALTGGQYVDALICARKP